MASNACQHTGAVPCTAHPAFKITFRLASGLELVERHCRHHTAVRADQIAAEGGAIIEAEALPEPPTIVLEPVGLDALTVEAGQ